MVTTEELTQIVALVPEMTEDQRDRLVTAVQCFTSNNGKASVIYGQHDTITDLVLDCIIESMALRSGVILGKGRLKVMVGFSRFPDKCKAIKDWADKALPQSSRIEQLALIRLGIGLLGDWLHRNHLPISHDMLMRNILQVPVVCDLAFPCYASAGLMGAVIKRETKYVRSQSKVRRERLLVRTR